MKALSNPCSTNSLLFKPRNSRRCGEIWRCGKHCKTTKFPIFACYMKSNAIHDAYYSLSELHTTPSNEVEALTVQDAQRLFMFVSKTLYLNLVDYMQLF